MCVKRRIVHTRSLLSGCSAGQHSFSALLPVPDALLCYAEYAQVAERPPSKELWVEEREENQQAFFFFFSAYETNVWHSTEHCSAVGLSVNRRQYARACWRLIWHWLPRNFKRKEELYTSPLLLLFFWGILCQCIPSLICNQLIAELKKTQKPATDVITQEFSHLHVWYVSLF